MKAFCISKPGCGKVIDTPDPRPQRGEVILAPILVGLCGSDLAAYQGRNPLVSYPRIPGHEIAGVIVETGEEVPPLFQIGQIVAVVPYTNCGLCSSCRRSRPHACRQNQTLGVQRDGGMCERLALPWQKLLPAHGISPERAALVEPLSVGFHAVERGQIGDGETVAVFGCGLIGLGAVARAARRGAEVIAVDLEASKLDLARVLGAAHVIDINAASLHDRLAAITQGHGPDVIIEASGAASSYRAAVEEASFSGRLVCIGYAKEDVLFATRLIVQKELDVLGSRNATPRDFQQALRCLQGADFPAERLLSRVLPLAAAEEALQTWAAAPALTAKILIRINAMPR